MELWLDEPHGGLFDELLDLLVGGWWYSHEGGLAAVGMGPIHAVQHEEVEMRVEIERRPETLHEGDTATANVVVAQRPGPGSRPLTVA